MYCENEETLFRQWISQHTPVNLIRKSAMKSFKKLRIGLILCAVRDPTKQTLSLSLSHFILQIIRMVMNLDIYMFISEFCNINCLSYLFDDIICSVGNSIITKQIIPCQTIQFQFKLNMFSVIRHSHISKINMG